MPTSASTGTRQVSTAEKKAPQAQDTSANPVAADASAKSTDPTKASVQSAKPHAPQPLADPSGNGLIQVRTRDGRHVNVDAGRRGWEDVVRELDPKHESIRHGS